METTTYFLARYQDGHEIGVAVLTADQFSRYMAMSDQPQGTVRLGSLPHDYYDLDPEYQDTHEDTTVFLST